MATAARRIVATPEGGGRPSRQSRPERLAFYQCPFMLPLEVVGPGGSLSTALIAMPYWRDASRRVSWQAAKATAEFSCDPGYGARPSAGDGRWWRRRADWFRRRQILNLFNSARLVSYHIRPFCIVNSARLFFRTHSAFFLICSR